MLTVLKDVVRSVVAEPAVADPPPTDWRDWVLVVGLVPVALVEAVLRDELVWPVASVGVTLGLLPTLLIRRSRPLLALLLVFGTISIIDIASVIAGVQWEGLGTTVYVLLLVYAVFRWGSGRDGVLALAAMSVPLGLTAIDVVRPPAGDQVIGDLLGGVVVLLAASALGASFRFREQDRVRGLDQVKLLEREQLARELHDTVAHHVTAIAIRAQAGRVVGATDPAAAVEALEVIEVEAARTLVEMRDLVGALRDGAEADLTPQRGLADIHRLADRTGDLPPVELELSGDLDHLRPSVDAALYRLAQESITNSTRHARHATRIRVSVRGDRDAIHLTVDDDGDPSPFDPRSASGFGLVGMAERAKLLGGTFAAGPDAPRGWTVDVVLPRAGRAS